MREGEGVAKRVVGISLGSKARDHQTEVEFLGETVYIERRGTDGDLNEAARLLRELDGKVDAFGLGGIDRYLFAAGRRYVIRDAERLASQAKMTPVVDGAGLKDSLERRVIQYLQEKGLISFRGKRVLMVAAVDRFGMAEALAASGCDLVFGDLMFALGIPIRLRSLRALSRLARLTLPIITRLPFKVLYPTGAKQHEIRPKYQEVYQWADIIAGDFHLIRRHLPDKLIGKIILTNTVTPADRELLRERGVAALITTTPNLGGRSFGTNVIEATLVAVSGRRPEELRPNDYFELLDKLEFQPWVESLQSEAAMAGSSV